MTTEQEIELIENANRFRSGHGPSDVNSTRGLQNLIRSVPRMKLVVEVGSNRGVSTESFALLCDHVIAVDCWNDKAHDDGAWEKFKEMMQRRRNVSVLRMYSLQASFLFTTGSVDMVYIDASHSYENIKEDITVWMTKTNLWLAGHDHNDSEPGVMKAVAEVGRPRLFEDSSWLLKTSGR